MNACSRLGACTPLHCGDPVATQATQSSPTPMHMAKVPAKAPHAADSVRLPALHRHNSSTYLLCAAMKHAQRHMHQAGCMVNMHLHSRAVSMHRASCSMAKAQALVDRFGKGRCGLSYSMSCCACMAPSSPDQHFTKGGHHNDAYFRGSTWCTSAVPPNCSETIA